MRKAGRPSVSLAFMSAVFAPALIHADALSELDDIAARIQYGSYSNDVRSIEAALDLLQRLELPQSRKSMKDYYAAYGNWKLAELHLDEAAAGQRSTRSAAAKSARTCETAAEAAIGTEPRLAEAHAIRAVCSNLASRTPEMLSLGSCARHKALRMARELEPGNPRIRLIEIQCSLSDEKDTQALLTRVQGLVKDFDTAPPASPGRPDWGHAEALVLLGRLQLQQGNSIAARDAFERALVIAPDYREAQDALAKTATQG